MTRTDDRPPEPTNQGEATDSTASAQFIRANLNNAEVSGQVAVGSYIVQVGSANGAKLDINVSEQPFPLRSRPTPIDKRPKSPVFPLGHKPDVGNAIAELREERSVEINGKAGIGKSTLLRYLAHHEITRDFPDGVVYLEMPWFQSVSDLLQRLLDLFYQRNPQIKLTDSQVEGELQSKKALVLLDDVQLSREQASKLLHSRMANFTFAIASKEQRLKEEYNLPLEDFSLDDALDLVRHELSRSGSGHRRLQPEERITIEQGERRWGEFLTSEEREAAETLWQVLKHSPEQIRREVARVRKQKCSLADIARQVESTPSVVALVKRLLEAMPEPVRRFLLVLAAVKGVALLPDRAEAITASLGADSSSIGEIQPHLESLPTQWRAKICQCIGRTRRR